MAAVETPKIVLYTNHGCPWAHRAHIALAELKLPFEEEIIDLSVPRTPEYLKVNPRGLVPSINYNGEIITESAVVATFLADAHPSHLWPAAGGAKGALVRARISFFVDTYFTKAGPLFMKAYTAKTAGEGQSYSAQLVDVLVKEIEPLLANAAPFFGGSKTLTLAEVLTGSFVLRLYSYPNHGLLPKSLLSDLAAKVPNFDKWAQQVIAHPSVNGIYNEEKIIPSVKARVAKMHAA